MGNPDVKPEMTVQYEFGYKQALSEDLGLDLTVFYKDIRDLLGVEFIETYNGAEYARLTNVDFGDVLGFTVALDQRPSGPVRHRARLHLAAGAGQLERPARDGHARRRRRGPAARAASRSTGTSATRST